MQGKNTVSYPTLPAFSLNTYCIDSTLPMARGRVTLFLADKPCTLFLSKSVFSLGESDLLWIPPFSACYALPGSRLHGVALTLPEDVLITALPNVCLPDGGKFSLSAGDAARLFRVFDSITKETDAFYTNLLAVLSVLEKSYYPDVETSVPLPRLIRRVLAYLTENPAENINTEALAERYGVSKSTLSRALRTHLGIGLTALRAKVRLAQAEKLLFYGISPEEAARGCGFSSLALLSNALRQAYGVSLKEYRKEIN